MARENSTTPIPFSPEEAAAIRSVFRRAGDKVACPRCGRDLDVSRPVAGGGTMPPVHELRCRFCRCSVVAAAGR